MGYHDRQVVAMPDRKLIRRTPFAIHTTMSILRDDRMGICGGPVVNKTGEIVGMHSGSSFDKMGEKFDHGYIVPAAQIKRLVEAYHHNGKALVPVVVDGKTILQCNVDEFFHDITLFNEEKKAVYTASFDEKKLPYTQLVKWMEIYHPAYIEFTVEHTKCGGTSKDFMVTGLYKNGEKVMDTYRYDAATGEIIKLSDTRTVFDF